MFSKIYWINEKEIGEKILGIMPRPRGNDWLEDELKSLKNRKVDYLISLLEDSETWDLGLANEKELCEKKAIHFINFPIEDVNIPKDEMKFLELAKYLSNEIKLGKKIVIHCRMGIGRSSILAAGIMIQLGCKRKEVFDLITKYRTLIVPDTLAQKNWLLGIMKV